MPPLPSSPHYFLAKLHPSRTYYFRQSQDVDSLLDACGKRLAENPSNIKARLLRATALMKKKAFAEAVEDFNLVISQSPNVRFCTSA